MSNKSKTPASYNYYEPGKIELPDRNFFWEFEPFTVDKFFNDKGLKDCENKLQIDSFLYFSTSQFLSKNKNKFEKGKFKGKSFDRLNERLGVTLAFYMLNNKETTCTLTEKHAKYFRNCYAFLLGKYREPQMKNVMEGFDELIDGIIFECDQEAINSLANELADNEDTKKLIQADIFLAFTLAVKWVNERCKEAAKGREQRGQNRVNERCKEAAEGREQRGQNRDEAFEQFIAYETQYARLLSNQLYQPIIKEKKKKTRK